MTKVRGSVGAVGVGVGVRVRVGETSEGIDVRETRGEGGTRRSAVLCPNLVLSSLVRDSDRGACRRGRVRHVVEVVIDER